MLPHPPNPHTPFYPSLIDLKFPQKRSRGSVEDQVCLWRSDRDSSGQAVQGIQGEEDVGLALKGAGPVPQQLAALQVWRDVLHANGLREVKVRVTHLESTVGNSTKVTFCDLVLHKTTNAC